MTDAVQGFVCVDKPAQMTSHDVVSRARRALGTRRVGHAGTLDPMATGVLVLGVGRATRLLSYATAGQKTYLATIRLGAATTTDDAEGEVLSRTDARSVSLDQIATGVAELTGVIAQRPSAVSAIKVDGRRAYARVRAGEQVDLAAREVAVRCFDVQSVTPTDEGYLDVDVTVTCSPGTYVRALARDLGEACGVGGHLRYLRRSASSGVDVAECVALDQVGPSTLLPVAELARRWLPAVTCTADVAEDVCHGRAVACSRLTWESPVDDAHQLLLLNPDGEAVAVGTVNADLIAPAIVLSDPPGR